jgi:hypothetical protein
MRSISVNGSTFKNLREYPVVRYAHDETARRFVIICHYWDTAPGSHSSFLRLRFDGVKGFQRLRGLSKALQLTTNDYPVGQEQILVQYAKSSLSMSGSNRVEFDFGPSFGGITFAFGSVSGEVIDTRVKQVDDHWEHYDLETGQPLSIENLFSR